MLNLLGVKFDRLRGINRTTGIFSGSCFLIAFYICCIICPVGICVYTLICEFRKYHVCMGDYQETASPSKKTRSQFGCTHVICDTLPSYLVFLVPVLVMDGNYPPVCLLRECHVGQWLFKEYLNIFLHFLL